MIVKLRYLHRRNFFYFIFGFIIIFLLGCKKLKSEFSNIFLEKDLLEQPPAQRCGECHKDIHKEWKKSRHAQAWVSEDFIKESKNRTDEKCLACHASFPVWAEESSFVEEPELREKHLDDGIYCVSCHFDPHRKAMVGPYDLWSPPHPSQKDDKILSSHLCGVCHQDTFSEWERSGVETTCQNCHMPDIGKKYLTQKFPFSFLHSRKKRTSHEFPALIAQQKDIDVKVQKDADGFYVYIINRGVPHNLPTADQGNPKLYIFIYKDNSSEPAEVLVFSPQQENSLEYMVPVSRYIEGIPRSVKVVIERRLSWKDERDKIGEWNFQISP